MSENAQNHPPQIPLCKRASALKQPRRCLLLPRLVLGPRVAPVTTRVHFRLASDTPGARAHRPRRAALPAPVRGEAGKDEDGLDVQALEGAQVSLKARGERKREATGRGEEGFPGGRVVCQGSQVVRRIDAEAGVGQRGQGQRRLVAPLLYKG